MKVYNKREIQELINQGKDISDLDVSEVTDMSYLFEDMTSFNQDISKWDVSNVTDMRFMFFGATSFNQSLENWNVSKVTNMSFIFDNISHKYSIDNCGKFNRTIYLNHINPNIVHIGCFYGSQNEAIQRIKENYSGESQLDYIDKVNELFNEMRKHQVGNF